MLRFTSSAAETLMAFSRAGFPLPAQIIAHACLMQHPYSDGLNLSGFSDRINSSGGSMSNSGMRFHPTDRTIHLMLGLVLRISLAHWFNNARCFSRLSISISIGKEKVQIHLFCLYTWLESARLINSSGQILHIASCQCLLPSNSCLPMETGCLNFSKQHAVGASSLWRIRANSSPPRRAFVFDSEYCWPFAVRLPLHSPVMAEQSGFS